MAPRKVLVLDVVGLTLELLRHAPRLKALASDGFVAPMDGVLPGVTCTAQATLLTGALPRTHGIVGNGWYFRDQAEVWLWRQSNHLVQGDKLLAELATASPPVTTANLFWWFNFHSGANFAITPRPHYFADGRKLPDCQTDPPELREELTAKLGTFPLFQFWGPTASIASTRWIADAALFVLQRHEPDLALVYLPHLDYDLQRFGPRDPRIPAAVAAVDIEAGKLIDHARATGREVVVVSEYGIDEVRGAVAINRVLRDGGWLSVRDGPCGELLDPGGSRAFAVADHQIAHVYVRRPCDLAAVQALLERTDGVERVLDAAGKHAAGLDHERAGELVALSARDRFFAYHYWLDDARAPDFARTVDIHRKPGYDPSELFFAPDVPALKLRLAATLLRKKLGFRYRMQAISLDPGLARGSHGLLPATPETAPLFLSSSRRDACEQVAMRSVKSRLLARLRGG
ncbi:MAG: alkaline phosphatase family protein [Planctomycetes bacterium]|nr:alkaline phosphatase family protein [Planctomycetota bacterium]